MLKACQRGEPVVPPAPGVSGTGPEEIEVPSTMAAARSVRLAELIPIAVVSWVLEVFANRVTLSSVLTSTWTMWSSSVPS